MSKPKIYLSNEGRLNDKYLFISYSHKESDDVYAVLEQLNKRGVNFWYDDGLDVGDVWNEKVEEIINNPDCVGALVFLGENSVKSDPVNKEIGMMVELGKQRDFTIAPIVIGAETVGDLLFNLSVNDRDFFQKTRDKNFHVNDIADFETSCKIEVCVPKIEKKARSIDAMETHSVLTNDSNIDKLPHIKENRSKAYQLGKYTQRLDGEKTKIGWEVIAGDGGIFYLISKYCLDFVPKHDIDATLDAIKNSIHEYRECVVDIMLPDENFLKEYADNITATYPTDYADERRKQLLRVNWVRSSECDGDYVLYNMLNAKVKENINCDSITGGIRPVIKIDSKKITSKTR